MALLAFVLVWLVALSVGLVTVRWALRRHSQVHRSVRTQTPVHWMVSPSASAILHRRLRSAVAMVEAAATPDDPLAMGVVQQAVQLDEDLIRLRRLKARERRLHRAEAYGRTRLVESAAYRVAELSKPRAPVGSETMEELANRIAYAEQAHAEIDAMIAQQSPSRTI